MPILYALFAVLALVFSMSMAVNRESTARDDESQLESLTQSILLYRNKVSDYRHDHLGFEGSVAVSDLKLPDWFYRPAEFGNYVSGGVAYIYYPTPPAGLLGVLVRKVESVGVGINVNGVLVSPMEGNTAIPLPAAVPKNSLVILQ